MRKADYAALADIIRTYRAQHAASRDVAASSAEQSHHIRTLSALECVARDFANSASVDKAAFLRACGIEPHKAHGKG